MRAGTRIEVRNTNFDGTEAWEPAVISPWNKKISGERKNYAGYHIIKCANGGFIKRHESNFRVVDNRA
jgi:hypothetical protein